MKKILLGGIVLVLAIGFKINTNRTVNTEPIVNDNIKLDNAIEEIRAIGQLVLTETTGTASIKYDSCKDRWNCWLTNTETMVSLDYRVLIGIDLKDVVFVDGGIEIIIITPKEFEVLSIETDNKKIESDYSFLSKIQSDEVKIQLEEKIVKDIKKDIITEEIKIEATKSFEDSLRKLANNLKINVRFY